MTTVPSPRQIRRAHNGQGRGLKLARAHTHDVAGRAYPGLRQRPARTRLRQRTNTTPRDFSDLTFLANSATAYLRYRAVDDDGLRVPASFARPWTRTRTRRRPPAPASIPRPDMYAHWPPGAPRASSPASSRRVSRFVYSCCAFSRSIHLFADPMLLCCHCQWARSSARSPVASSAWPRRRACCAARASAASRARWCPWRSSSRCGAPTSRQSGASSTWSVAHAPTLSFRRPGRPVLISFLGLVVFFLLARCHLELAHRPPCAREGGPRRAQRRREPGACVRAHHTVTESPSKLTLLSLPCHTLVGSCR